jgi:DDE family transposase
MQTECISGQLEFEELDGRRVVAAFDGGAVTSDAGALLLRETDRAIRLIERVAACFSDGRDPGQLVHALPTLVGQRIVAIARGYEDVNDHDRLRFDPLALFGDSLEAKRKDCALAGKSTMNRLEHAPGAGGDRYHKIGCDREALQDVFVDVFLDAHGEAPREIVLDLSMPPTIPCTATRKAGSSTAIMTVTVICRSLRSRSEPGRRRSPG